MIEVVTIDYCPVCGELCAPIGQTKESPPRIVMTPCRDAVTVEAFEGES